MRDDDDALAGIDLAAWQPPAPPADLADAVIARLRTPAAVAAVEPGAPPARRGRWIAGAGAAAIVAIGAFAARGLIRAPRDDHGELVATTARHLALEGTSADLDPGAELRWTRDGRRLTALQAHGTVRWTVADDDTLVIHPGGPGTAHTIEASGASLRVEAPMNLFDVRLVGISSVTAAAVAAITVAVYTGHVQVTSGGQTVTVAPGASLALGPPQPPSKDAVAVGASPAELDALRAQLERADDEIRELRLALAARPAPPPAPPADKPVTLPAGARSGKSRAAGTAKQAPPPLAPVDCATVNVDDLMEQARNQYQAGFANAASLLMQKSLVCKQDNRMYRLAAIYACAAHDEFLVRAMLGKVTNEAHRAGIEQKCQLEGINLRP